ncbi:GPR1/FUN34/yaaH family-domain-containing protein [Rhodofomes roseus]|uniref:GPR1/FUN34/yaaH family-domain-containing protein n=1 Tax=Rhodofomes roseus TaxID=34475 RepID=A0ABQ8JYV0_9APHY|nr:GPR1/FUN34/yaaH family-domain-containing protein [Rhodofomes roseus]KAH9828955.1 GPR1/FUN34/yaaH family-domain-containing protein [Rhodofomes roseus]
MAIRELREASTPCFLCCLRPTTDATNYDRLRSIMSVPSDDITKIGVILDSTPRVQIFLRPIAAPAALGLAGFAGSTWITASYIAAWWGGPSSPTIFFPFVTLFGGLAQFLAGLQGFPARDVLVTVVHTMWGCFWMSAGLVWLLTACDVLPARTLADHSSEMASWMVVLMTFTWICAVGAFARDMILFGILLSLAIGCTLATGGWYAFGSGAYATVKAAAYFWMISALLATWRCAVYIWEENWGKSPMYPVFRTVREEAAPYMMPGLGEPGVKRGVPKPLDRRDLIHKGFTNGEAMAA